MNLKDKIAEIPDFPKKGILFRDISPLLRDPAALSLMMEEFQGLSGFTRATGIFINLEPVLLSSLPERLLSLCRS